MTIKKQMVGKYHNPILKNKKILRSNKKRLEEMLREASSSQSLAMTIPRARITGPKNKIYLMRALLLIQKIRNY